LFSPSSPPWIFTYIISLLVVFIVAHQENCMINILATSVENSWAVEEKRGISWDYNCCWSDLKELFKGLAVIDNEFVLGNFKSLHGRSVPARLVPSGVGVKVRKSDSIIDNIAICVVHHASIAS
jgi:hypothetical protein